MKRKGKVRGEGKERSGQTQRERAGLQSRVPNYKRESVGKRRRRRRRRRASYHVH